MKKHILFLLFLALSTLTQAQPWRDSIGINITTNPPTSGWMYNYKASGTTVGDIITYCDTTFRSQRVFLASQYNNYDHQPGGTRYFGSGEVERTITWFPAHTPFLSVSDSMRVILLLAEAQAIILDNVAEQVLLQVLHYHFLEPDFYQNYFLEAFPATLDLHIQRKSPYAIAARGLKQRYFPEKK